MKPSPLRWLVAFALFIAALLNYTDRSVLGLLADTIQADLNITNQEYATINNCFLIAYTVANLISGRIVDKLGVRLGLALFLIWWTVANALTGLARSFGQICGLRFMLGLGEAGCYTASPKAISDWFPAAERGTAVGFYSAGGAVGATLAPVMVALVASQFGWRAVFCVTPIAAALWMVLWFWLYQRRNADLETSENQVAESANSDAIVEAPAESEWSLWRRVLSEPLVWRLMLVRLITDPTWYFFQIWMPKYLRKTWGLDQSGLSILGMIFLAATIGFLLGGYLSGRFIKRGIAPAAARVWAMLISAVLVPLSLAISFASSLHLVIGIGMIVVYAAASWLSNITALTVDLVPKRILGTAFGVIACGSALGGFFMNKAVAWLVDCHSYNYCFYVMAFLHPVALLLIWNLRRNRTPETVENLSSEVAK